MSATRFGIGLLLVGAIVAGVLAAVRPADAAFPGVNGKILFRSTRDSNHEVYAMNADGTGQTNLTNNPARDTFPAGSPDGTEIAFQSNRDGNVEVYLMNVDGTGQARLTNNPAFDGDPGWSPDGTKIAFSSNRDGNVEIYVMNADGTGQARLTNNPAGEFHVNWSPDGTKIAFVSNRDGNFEIYVMNADGTGQTRLTNNPAIEFNPNWSPDGTEIVFESNRDGVSEIYIMNADGTGQTRLTFISAFDRLPDWQPLPPCTDVAPPTLSVSLSPNVLTPPDRTMRTVNAAVSVSDDCDASPSVVLESITLSGPDIPNPPQGPLAGPDIQGANLETDDRQFQLRAEIDADGTDRVYTVTYRAQDASGKTTTASAMVTVAIGR